ncbi:hypothetical protein JNB11_05310 [Kocuria palustris]|nr:hypothetical protein [Kocuria palustris]
MPDIPFPPLLGEWLVTGITKASLLDVKSQSGNDDEEECQAVDPTYFFPKISSMVPGSVAEVTGVKFST